MKLKRLILPLSLIPLAAIAVFLLQPSEPKYHGKTLNELLTMADEPELISGNIDPTNAIREMGQRAIPTLLKMLQTEDPPITGSRVEALKRDMYSDSEVTPPHKIRQQACRGFEILGPLANPAIPSLAKLLANTNVAAEVVWALRGIGPDATETLVTAATNQNALARTWAIIGLGQLGTNSATAVPALVPCLSDPDFRVRIIAATSLGQLRQQPALVVPLLSNRLADPNGFVRHAAKTALSEFATKGDALPLVPKQP